MTSYTQLGYNVDEMKMYGNERIAIGVSLFFAYLLHYSFYAICTYWKQEKGERIKFISQRLWLFGMCAALSTGYIQGSVFTGVLAW